jgi:hypothetical protein
VHSINERDHATGYALKKRYPTHCVGYRETGKN